MSLAKNKQVRAKNKRDTYCTSYKCFILLSGQKQTTALGLHISPYARINSLTNLKTKATLKT